MKKLILLLPFLLFSCAEGTFNQGLIDTGITTGVTVGLQTGIKDPEKRTMIADYVDVGAAALYAITGTPTPQELATMVDSWIPDNVKQQYPYVPAFITPLITSAYDMGIKKYGKDTEKTRVLLNRIAADLQAGAACCITKH